MLLLTAEKISKKYTDKALLEDVVLGINEGDKIGLIGVNGTGKSTLLKIIAGIETPDSGVITKASGVRVGYLPQNPEFKSGLTVLQQAMKGIALQQRESKEYECKAILTKLGLTDFDEPVDILSGGQKKRLSIASALVTPVDVLILDEPTNHIDNNTVDWLETYLSKYNGALLMVTHDRYFLDRVTNKIIELQNGNLYSYQGNYSKFLELKIERETMLVASERKRQSFLRKELAWIQQGPKARGTKQQFRVNRFAEMSQQEVNLDQEQLQMSSISTRLGKKIISLENVTKSYEEKVLINNFSYNLLRNDRIGIVGENGCGKSTLLKIIQGYITPDSGTVDIGQTVKIGYFSQECEELNPTERVIDYISNISSEVITPEGTFSASQMLERFLFSSNLQYSTVNRLSGGEKRRLYLLGILMEAPNVLLFDEPTNDLDTQTLTILEDYLDNFNGAVIVVSHDRYFLDKVADYIFAFTDNGEIVPYVGGYSDYIEKIKLSQVKGEKEKPVAKEQDDSRRKSTKLKFSYNEQREYDTIDVVIADLEAQIEQAEADIVKEASNYTLLQELLHQKEELEQKLAEKMERWVYLNDLSERIEAQNNNQ
ncbi:ABC-F family ATP-binding cassette domain-containing protein [Paludicola sp. MB14-C6]|uniref:ABC-F family ATP-binding cassette domain-containing protein n=1 Tax=Paludihabitans sp. MB14-C6 TaxID=3070656 RepID=UPI0027DAE5EE|nr:ABC-F family ATP-binding cassette domain-containing protein [Paludicola sp. MB14-C6]WMJ22512.1 ABC-F family ATP-binding cassette domain-containing protein [Paludicola sp. MB14-C6]